MTFKTRLTSRIMTGALLSLLGSGAATASEPTVNGPESSATPTSSSGPAQPVAVGRYSISLPGGGLIWATEDPTLGQPSLTVSTNDVVAVAGGRLTEPLRFFSYSNYAAFMNELEVLIYRASDVDLVDPVARLHLPLGAVGEAEWDGTLLRDLDLRPGEELVYIARAHGDASAFDETFPRRIRLVTPEDAERRSQTQRVATERRFGEAFSIGEAERRTQLETIFGENALRIQNITVRGSRIRIQGRGIPEGSSVRINGRDHPVDLERKFVAEYLTPIGTHDFDVEVGSGADRVEEKLRIDVSGRYNFLVGMADLTLARNKVSGSVSPAEIDTRFEDDFLLSGRLAFYAKQKFGARYLLTAQADTREQEVQHLFKGFWKADPQDVFRRLDPDLYYPTYGDDSTTYRDVDTQGRLYARLDWDKNQLLFGNYDTQFTGTEFAHYTRAIYGVAADLKSNGTTALGEPTGQLRAFGSEIQTAAGHSEFLGTGASLYLLRDTDVLPGSERLAIEVRDPTTGRVERRSELVRGADYDIDELQGRVLLTRPLTPVTRDGVRGLTADTPLDGYLQILVADYEYVPQGFDPDVSAGGIRAKKWFGDHLGVGVTHVREDRAGDDYRLTGADVTLQAGRGTYLKIEHSRTKNSGVPTYYSDNGGLTFARSNISLGARKGQATSLDGRINLRELGVTAGDWAAGAWWRHVDSGFSIARYDTGEPIEEYGAEMQGTLGRNFDLYLRYSSAERGADALTQAQVTTTWRFAEEASLGAEIRYVDEQRGAGGGEATLAALRYTQYVTPSLELYGQLQTSFGTRGDYADNDAATIGGSYAFADRSTLGGEATTGDRGDAVRLNVEHAINSNHTIYAAYTASSDRTDYEPLFSTQSDNGWSIGQRWRVSNKLNVFNESQYLKARGEAGLAHSFGLDFYPADGWNLGFTYTKAELQRTLVDDLFGVVKRDAISVSGGLNTRDTQWQSKLEWRRDRGLEDRTQWVTTNRVMHRINDSLRIAGRLNYSETTDRLQPDAGARFLESNVGFALRPWNSTRWALFGRHTYLYDVSSLSQVGESVALYDQKTQVFSFEGVFNPDKSWEFAAKLARREGKVRFGRMTGAWAESGATFGAGQVRLELADQWYGLAEARWLGVDDGGDRRGFLVGIDRDIGDHLRIGLGYNFTEFSDDLTDFDYDHKGLFLNLNGRF